MFGRHPNKLVILLFLIFSSICYADTRTDQPGPIFGDIDGTNVGRYRSVKFSNGATTNNGDGSISVTAGSGSSQWTTSGNDIFNSNSGNVGIGTNNPNFGKFTIWDAADARPINFLTALNVYDDGIMQIDYGGNIHTEGKIITGNNIGIGSTAPGTALDVNGFIRSTSLTGSKCVHTDATGTLTSAAADCGSGGSAVGNANSVQYTTGSGNFAGDNTKFSFNGTNVGIGTAVPSSLLEVGNQKFNVLAGGNVGIAVSLPINLFDVASKFEVQSNGNVGVGITSPNSLFDVNSKLNVLSSGNVGIGSVTPGQVLDVNGNIRERGTNSLIFGDDNITSITATAATAGGMKFTANNAEIMRITPGGDVGIGSTAPNYKFDVNNGAVDIGTAPMPTDSSSLLNVGVSNANTYFNVGQDATHLMQFQWAYNATPGSATAGVVTYGYSNPFSIDASAITMQLASGGNIGIGVVAPTIYKLDIGGKTHATGMKIGDWSLEPDTSNLLNVGRATTNTYLNVGQDSTHTVQFGWTYNATAANAIGALNTFGYTNDFDIDVNRLVLQANSGGNVGINSANPGQKLDVQGAVRTSTIGAASTGDILCKKADNSIGYCSGVLTGLVCTCN